MLIARSRKIVFAAVAALIASQVVHGDVIDVMIGDDDGFGGTQGANSDPGQAFLVFGSPSIPPGSWDGTLATDASTQVPWMPYIFTFSFSVSVPEFTCIGAAEVRIQHGSVARRDDGSGFGPATVSASLDGPPLSLGSFWPMSTGAAGSPSEETVKLTVLDVSPLLQPGATGVLIVTVDGTALSAPADQFAIDFAVLHISGRSPGGLPDRRGRRWLSGRLRLDRARS